MKTKLLLTAALAGFTTLSAQAGVCFGFSIGVPVVAPVVVAAPVAPVPVVAAPSAVVAAPACPGPGYIWAPGYWSVRGGGRVWVGGCWHYRPVYRGSAIRTVAIGGNGVAAPRGRVCRGA
jgi:WXXGXW repeat (2 copies)